MTDEQFNLLCDRVIARIDAHLAKRQVKDYYTPEELAESLGKSAYTIRERWCNAGKIECQKTGAGKWLIPAAEYERLVKRSVA